MNEYPPGHAQARWAVIGAHGFIGSALTRRLVTGHGVHVRGVNRRHARADSVSSAMCEMVVPGSDDVMRLAEVLEGCSVVVDCAFDPGRLKGNVTRAATLVSAAARARVRRVVHVSSLAVHEPLLGDVIDEDSPTPGTASAYAATKLRAEQAAARVGYEENVEVVRVRPTIVYGPGARAWTMMPAERLLRGGVVLPAAGRGICNAVHIDDLVDGLVCAAMHGSVAGRALLVSGPCPVTWNDFYSAIGAQIGLTNRVYTEANVSRDPWGSRQASRLIRGSEKLLQRPRVRALSMLARQLAAVQVRHRPAGQERALYEAHAVVSIERARSAGYEPSRNLQTGMRDTGSWLRGSLVAP